MPVVQFLQDTFQGPVLHLPLGQASDAAHLPNERLRVKNLTNVRATRVYLSPVFIALYVSGNKGSALLF